MSVNLNRACDWRFLKKFQKLTDSPNNALRHVVNGRRNRRQIIIHTAMSGGCPFEIVRQRPHDAKHKSRQRQRYQDEKKLWHAYPEHRNSPLIGEALEPRGIRRILVSMVERVEEYLVLSFALHCRRPTTRITPCLNLFSKSNQR